MYTEEDAYVHKQAMIAIRQEMKKPRTWAEFRKLQREVKSMQLKHLDQAAQNHQSDWEQAFVNSLGGLELQLVLIANNGVTKRLKCESRQALDQLGKIKDQIMAEREAAVVAGEEFIVYPPRQRYWLRRLKTAFRAKK